MIPATVDKRTIVDMVRQTMYGDGNFYDDLEVLAESLAKYDGVDFDREMFRSNRLIQALIELQSNNPKLFKRIER